MDFYSMDKRFKILGRWRKRYFPGVRTVSPFDRNVILAGDIVTVNEDEDTAFGPLGGPFLVLRVTDKFWSEPFAVLVNPSTGEYPDYSNWATPMAATGACKIDYFRTMARHVATKGRKKKK